jgi:hypothetical protein
MSVILTLGRLSQEDCEFKAAWVIKLDPVSKNQPWWGDKGE